MEPVNELKQKDHTSNDDDQKRFTLQIDDQECGRVKGVITKSVTAKATHAPMSYAYSLPTEVVRRNHQYYPASFALLMYMQDWGRPSSGPAA